ncbi:hypothetical protein E2C01_093044 [Portunus trituberculatus]|uniref:Uncharacterized protein n=1 Tax=Portunus trituberculatus TaxID=210409 RepID=A0A5B7JX40_PORTR|nr:hypothetical protein [Portunus trituberculatus]
MAALARPPVVRSEYVSRPDATWSVWRSDQYTSLHPSYLPSFPPVSLCCPSSYTDYSHHSSFIPFLNNLAKTVICPVDPAKTSPNQQDPDTGYTRCFTSQSQMV